MIVLQLIIFFFQAEDGIRDLVRSRGLGDVYKRQVLTQVVTRGDGLVGEDITGNVIGRVYGLPNLLNLSLIHI